MPMQRDAVDLLLRRRCGLLCGCVGTDGGDGSAQGGLLSVGGQPDPLCYQPRSGEAAVPPGAACVPGEGPDAGGSAAGS